ncbi:MAG: choice-of-anchor tandem repeat GloVer-containing protein [Rhodopila sp.]|jgi:uncharacterized repeat protein (TIGR03803 family)
MTSPTLTTLLTFNSTNEKPFEGLTADAAGNLYGTAFEGGANKDGTLVELAAGTHALSTLVSFDGTDPDPGPLAIDSAGNVYGATRDPDESTGGGTLFEVAAGSHAFTKVATLNSQLFPGPVTDLFVDAAGNLHGVSESLPYRSDASLVFEMAAGAKTITTVGSFDQEPEYVYAATVDAAGNAYVVAGGTRLPDANPPAVFEVAAGTNAFAEMYSTDLAEVDPSLLTSADQC